MMQNSNNYNMKNQPMRYNKGLDLLFAECTLREDSNFFTKLIICECDKKVRGKYLHQLQVLEKKRIQQQQGILGLFEGIEMNQNWKNTLFGYSNRVYKVLKRYHHKMLNISTKMAQMSETNLLIQNFRTLCIQKLSEVVQVKYFLSFLVESLRKNSEKETIIYSSGSNSKVVQNFRREESIKISRYFPLLKDNSPDLYLTCQQRTQLKINLELKKILKEIREPHPYYQYCSLMDLDDESDPYAFNFQNGMSINFAYLEEGLCEFIIGKWLRMAKEMKNRNEYNERIQTKFRQKYSQFQRKTNMTNSSKIYHRFSNIQLKEDKNYNKNNDSIEMRQFPSYFELKTPHNNTDYNRSEENPQKGKKMSIFKINKVESRKRSHTLRPLCESKENKEVIHQKVIEMKLVDATTPHAIKNMRIRKRRPFPIIKDESSWSVLMRENQHTSKLAICIH